MNSERVAPPKARQEAEERRRREAACNTLPGFAERYLRERGLRPNTVQGYAALLRSRILPYFGEMPLRDITLSVIKAWRASLGPSTESTNAAAYRLLRSILQAAEEEELIDRVPPKVRGAATARVRRVAVPATLDELATITHHMPDRLKLLVVLAAYVGLRQGELLELRRSDVDGVTGRISVSRKIDKDVIPGAKGACPNCGRAISAPKTASGVRTVHIPPPFLAILQKHLLEHTAAGPTGLLFPGDRTDHMSVRYLMDHYRPAREAAGRPDPDEPPPAPHRPDPRRPEPAAELQAHASQASQAAIWRCINTPPSTATGRSRKDPSDV